MKIPLALLLLGLLGGTLALAADPGVPALDAVRLAAFMDKWVPYQPTNSPPYETDGSLLLAALVKDPTGPWHAYLLTQFAEGRLQLRILAQPARQTTAAKFVTALKRDEQILAAAIPQGGTNAASLTSAQVMLQNYLSAFLLEAGPAYLPDASALGQRMLAQLPATNAYDYGTLIYQANQLLGRVALREGKLESARDYLRQAGQAPGTSHLFFIGPDNRLALELLWHGEPADRAAVLSYLDDIAHFWALPPSHYVNAQITIANHLKQLDAWKTSIRAGNIPDDLRWR